MTRIDDPVHRYRTQGFTPQEQTPPGLTDETKPIPDHGERTYVGSARLADRRALITGGDSGIGRAVAIAYAREGADVAIAYLPEEEADAAATAGWIEQAGMRSLRLPGDLRDIAHSYRLVERVIAEFGGLDILVLNAAYQQARNGLETVPPEEIRRVVDTNLLAPLWTTRAAIPHLQAGAAIIVTTSIQAYDPDPGLIDYAMTKAALVAFTKALAQELGPRGIRVNAVAPGPIWTPLIPATGWPDHLPDFGQNTALGRAGQPAELAPAYVFLAAPEASYVSGAVVPVTGGRGL
ncbi:MAG TPA: SDR family oxidoreductase [Microbacteriaceae bacterium]|nr:SDR family oxidoreductase [Microbacteriaceae bacterium]